MNENIKAVWKYYAVAFLGIFLLWTGRQATLRGYPAWACNVLFVLGAVGLFTGAVFVTIWNIRRGRAERAEDAASGKKTGKKQKK